jgi:hypothetical protein
MSASDHRQDVQDDTGDRMTVGKVQKEIRIGMSSEAVAQTLGSPNIVTTDEKRRESWIYDKISTDRVFSRSSGGVSALILGGAPVGGGILGGLGGGNVEKQAGASSTRQRTLTVIIKFDEESKVRDFAYNYTQF